MAPFDNVSLDPRLSLTLGVVPGSQDLGTPAPPTTPSFAPQPTPVMDPNASGRFTVSMPQTAANSQLGSMDPAKRAEFNKLDPDQQYDVLNPKKQEEQQLGTDIRDFAAMAAAAGSLASMFLPKPKVFRPGGATPMVPRFGNPFPRS